MTETVQGAPKTPDERPRGLRIQRLYTKPGVHPYDEVTWERRDVVMTNWRDGSVNFEQRGVEFPADWSLNATNIVTTKYFRGAVGSPQRESSLRQLIDRVVSTYVRAGLDNGYFATAEDAEIFEHELTYMLVHQIFSFNSPVWFNVGTSAPQQVSACFILAVDDTMDSILNWYKEEGLIFKGGSGAGVNLSRIRSSRELLSSGGTASGPVSFMRGADASAGTIKSGGATRRAAKMVILDVDHPDIEEFIETKAREEKKVRVLRDAGYDMDLGGRDIISVQYQNANNSVRVSDEFMRAVEEGRPFELRGRLDGAVIDSVDARTLFRSMTAAAWECADPGIQYDDTINDWHTCPDSGRITASNPCFTGDSLVHTDKGLVRFDELVRRVTEGETFGVFTHDITNEEEPTQRVVVTSPTAFMITGTNEVVRLQFSNGMEVRCTPGHRIFTVNRGYVEAKDLTVDDSVQTLDVPAPAVSAEGRLPVHSDAVGSEQLGVRRVAIELPEKWSSELAHYLGWLVGDGSATSHQAVAASYGCPEDRQHVLPRHTELVTRMNGGRAPKTSVQANGTVRQRLTRRALVRFFRALGLTPAQGQKKTVPWSILQAPTDVVAGFLQGLFDAGGCVRVDQSTNYVALGSPSRQLLLDVQRLLATFGIASTVDRVRGSGSSSSVEARRDGTTVRLRQRAAWELRIAEDAATEYAASIGFSLPGKQLALEGILEGRAWGRSRPGGTHLVRREPAGFELTYNLTEPRNHSYIVNGIVVRNCSEYLHLDNSSCNLASLNLLKFLRDDDTFDIAKFSRAVELVITAMDISICFADFPTEPIGRTTRAYRQLGIGYANLGALLMATGHAYDSEGGRSIASAITSLMTGTAYKRSAELAGVVGPYDGFSRNADAHKRIMRKHAAANDAVRPVDSEAAKILQAAATAWSDCLAIGERNGWRNAQASVLAPTGTIGLAMDVDTTGVEPDLALVKFKKLVGGGSMQIVNQTVPRALQNLGYPQEQAEAIVEHIAEHGNVIDAPGLRPDHYEVFDCAIGERAIQPMGHVRMLAAVQPFISGSVSKTVNMPESATVEDVEDIYFQGWKLGLKALAIYRDNCKVGQPLTDARAVARRSSSVGETMEHPIRKRLPKSRSGQTVSFSVGGAEGYMTANAYEDDGLGEIFLKMSKQGSTLAGVMDAFSIAISIALQYGVPLETYVGKFINMRFDPAGMTDDPDVRIAQSVMDYIFRRLALDYLPPEKRAELGIFTAAERAASLTAGHSAPAADTEDVDVESLAQSAPVEPSAAGPPTPADVVPGQFDGAGIDLTSQTAVDAPLCFTCGIKMRPAGSCYVCESCGSTSGCS
jgi:ribonucleoside-diphosphate reductase alpha chain